MFKFLKRFTEPQPKKPVRRRKKSSGSPATEITSGPAPLPQVTEGNEETDWSLWEDSVTALDSQMQALGPSSRISEASSDYQDVDAFSRVAKKDD